MATKRGKRSTKKVKSLRTKSLSASKAKRVRGGASFGVKKVDSSYKYNDTSANRIFIK